MSRSRKLLFVAVLVTLTLCVCVGAAELLVRVGLGDMDYAMEMWKYAHILKRVSGDPAQVFSHAPNHAAHLMGVDVRINSHGLRGAEIPYDRPAGTRRVLMLGDSLTFGWGVAEPEVTSSQLQKRLDERAGERHFQVVNSGVGNYNTRLEVHYLEQEGLRYDPEVVVLNYFINDAEPDPRYSGTFINEHFASWVFVANRLDVVKRRMSGGAGWDAYYRGLYEPDAEGWRAAKQAIARFGEVCRSHRLRCLVVHQPELHQLKPYPFADVDTAVAGAARAAALPFFDLLPVIQDLDPASLWVSVQDTHPNARCDALYANALADQVLAIDRAEPARP